MNNECPAECGRHHTFSHSYRSNTLLFVYTHGGFGPIPAIEKRRYENKNGAHVEESEWNARDVPSISRDPVDLRCGNEVMQKKVGDDRRQKNRQ